MKISVVLFTTLLLFGEDRDISSVDKIISQKQKYYDELNSTTSYNVKLQKTKINELQGYIFSKKKQEELDSKKTPSELISSLKVVKGLEVGTLPILVKNKIIKGGKMVKQKTINHKPLSDIEKMLYNVNKKGK